MQDSVEDLRAAGFVNGKPAVMVIVFRQPGANIIETVDNVRELLPQLEAALPGAVNLSIVLDRSPSIRGSLRDVEWTLLASGVLVILVVFWFLRNVRATIIPAVAVTVSIIGTFGVMYLFGYSLDNLSLMALTISTGFVVDDAIVVLENVTRYREQGRVSPSGGAVRHQGDRLHGPVHEHFACCRIHPDSADGRHGGQALSGIRGDALRGDHGLAPRVAHHDADDVRHDPEAGEERATRHPVPRKRTVVQLDARSLRKESSLGARPLPVHACRRSCSRS